MSYRSSSIDKPESLTNEQWESLRAKITEPVTSQRQEAATQAYVKDVKPEAIAGYIDHTVLKLDATEEDIKKMCNEAVTHAFAVRRHQGSSYCGADHDRPFAYVFHS